MEFSPQTLLLFPNQSSYQINNILLCRSVFMSLFQFPSDYSSLHAEMTKKQKKSAQFSYKYSLLDEGTKNLKRKKRKNMANPHTNYFVIILDLFQAFLSEHESRSNSFFRALLFSQLCCRTMSYHAIENTFIYF